MDEYARAPNDDADVVRASPEKGGCASKGGPIFFRYITEVLM